MLRMFVEEAAALASITLFVGDDRGLGAGDSAALRPGGNLIQAALADGLGKSRMAGAEAAFRVDSARPRHHHCG